MTNTPVLFILVQMAGHNIRWTTSATTEHTYVRLIQFNSIYFSCRLKAHDINSYTVKYIYKIYCRYQTETDRNLQFVWWNMNACSMKIVNLILKHLQWSLVVCMTHELCVKHNNSTRTHSDELRELTVFTVFKRLVGYSLTCIVL